MELVSAVCRFGTLGVLVLIILLAYRITVFLLVLGRDPDEIELDDKLAGLRVTASLKPRRK